MEKNDFFENHPDFYSYEDAVKRVEEFEEILKKYNIEIKENSILEKICLNVIDLLYKHENPEINTDDTEIKNYISEIIGLEDLIQKIIRVKNHDDFEILISHLEELNKGSFNQNMCSLANNQVQNKIFELLMTTIVMHFAHDIKLENPIHSSKAKNPDIKFNFFEQKWSIECKVMNTSNIKTLIERFEEGIEQINSSEEDRGLVVVNLKNVIKHEQIFKPINDFGNFFYNNIEIPKFLLFQYTRRISNEIKEKFDIIKKIEFEKALPGVLFFLQTTILISINKFILPTSLGIFNYMPLKDILDIHEYELLYQLNHAMHNKRKI